MKFLSRFLFGKAQLIKAKAQRERKHKLRENAKKVEAQKKEQRLRDSILRAQTYPVLRLTQEEYLGLESMAGKPKGFFSTEGLKKLILGTLYKMAIDQVVIMVVKGDEVFCEQWGASLSVPSVWVNYYKIDLIEVIDTHGPAIEGLTTKRLTQVEWNAIPSIKDKPENFIEESCIKTYVYPVYFRSKEDFLIQVTKDEKGKIHERILFTEIVNIVKPYSAQKLLKTL